MEEVAKKAIRDISLITDHMPLFLSHMTPSEAAQLKINDKVDHRDCVHRFLQATIVDKVRSNLKIHYDGWSDKHDTWCDCASIHRFADAGSISKRPAHRFTNLKIGDMIDINPKYQHRGWKQGHIERMNGESGQVQVAYECRGKYYLYWAHLDNKQEIAEFQSKSKDGNDLQSKKRKFDENSDNRPAKRMKEIDALKKENREYASN